MIERNLTKLQSIDSSDPLSTLPTSKNESDEQSELAINIKLTETNNEVELTPEKETTIYYVDPSVSRPYSKHKIRNPNDPLRFFDKTL